MASSWRAAGGQACHFRCWPYGSLHLGVDRRASAVGIPNSQCRLKQHNGTHSEPRIQTPPTISPGAVRDSSGTKEPAAILRWLVPLSLLLTASADLFLRFRAGAGFLAYFDDDCFYYLQIARNIAAGHGSTFDGMHATNGYHPLWMLVLVALFKLLPAQRLFFVGFDLVIVAGTMATYVLALRCFRGYAASGVLAQLAAAGLATCALLLTNGGMEIVLTIPLLFAFAAYRLNSFRWQPREAFLLGGIGTLLVLSRLDTLIFLLILAGMELLFGDGIALRQRIRSACAFVAALVPVGLYFLWNQFAFGSAMPFSGRAKQLRRHLAIDMHFYFLRRFPGKIVLLLLLPVLLTVVVAVLMLALRGKGRLRGGHRALLAALLVFQPAYLLLVTLLSDWPVWTWYLYPTLGAGLAAGVIICASEVHLSAWPRNLLTAVLALFYLTVACGDPVFAFRNAHRVEKPLFSAYLTGIDLDHFAASHPGIYAMGDHAGTAGYLLHQPLVQMEGLVEDRNFLQQIRAERDLHAVMEQYGVRYYVFANPVKVNGCYLAVEPHAGGRDSYHMRGLFCSTPVAQFQHDVYHTYVFDLAAGDQPHLPSH